MAQVDFPREIRRMLAFVDPGAFTSTDLAELLQADFWPLSFGNLCQQRCIHTGDNVEKVIRRVSRADVSRGFRCVP